MQVVSKNLQQLCDINGLVGHKKQILELSKSLDKGKIHHAWLFTGIKGIGKSMIADIFAAAVLSGNLLDVSQVSEKINNSSHLDFAKVEPDESGSIKIDAIRQLKDFLNFKAIDSKYRVVIIDAIDNLNNNAQNALLKTLEEPNPNTILILINHALGKILPTIISRCRLLKFYKPTLHEFVTLANTHSVKLSSEQIEQVYDYADGSMAILNYIKDEKNLHLYQLVQQLINGDNNLLAAVSLAVEDEEKWQIVKLAAFNAFYNIIINNNNNSLEQNYKLSSLQQLFHNIDQFHLDRVNAFRSFFA